MKKPSNILFIINPISGIGRQKTIEKNVEKYLDKSIFSPSFAYTQHPKHGTEIAFNAVKQNYEFIVAVGGDGSVNEIGKSLINTNSTLGIIPTGSGNGLARCLNIPTKVKDAIVLLNSLSIKTIDTAKLNNDLFLGTAGIGFDAFISHEFSNYGKRGFSSYIKLVLKKFKSYQPNTYTIHLDNKTITPTALLITIANSNQYGNNAYIAPDSTLFDGFLRVVIIEKPPAYGISKLLYLLFNKKIHTSKYVSTYKTKSVTIEAQKNIIHIDGEPIKNKEQIRIEIIPQSLKIIA